MDVLKMDRQPPVLNNPVLVAAFRGWNDAGEAASGALEALHDALAAEPFARIDPEEFFDFQVNRPEVRFQDEVRRLEWPRNAFSWASLPGGGHVLLLSGTEPNLRWQSFTHAILDLATSLGVERIVTLGALQVDVPHTRPAPLTGSASPPALSDRLGLRRSSYEGPTGITGVLHQACLERGMEAVSLWAGVPHYLAGSSYLAGVLAVAERVVEVLGVEVSLDQLARDALAQREDIGALVSEDEDLTEYVAELEARADARPDPLHTDELPAPPVSGEQLAADFERYLRDRGLDG